MALDAVPLRNRRRDLYIKAETTTNTAPTFDTASASIVVYFDDNPLDEDISFIERPKMHDVGNYASAPGERKGMFTFETDLIGSSATPTFATVLLVACGFTVTGRVATFNPMGESTLNTVSLGFWEDGRFRVMTGCKGAASITETTSGNSARMKFVMTGNIQPDADAVAVVGTKVPVIGPRWANANALTFGTLPLVCSKFGIDFGAGVAMRASANETTGFRSAMIGDANPKMTLDPEANLVANQAIQAAILAATEHAWSIQLGSVTNNIVTISGAKAQIKKRTGGKREKSLIESLDVQLNDLAAITWS